MGYLRNIAIMILPLVDVDNLTDGLARGHDKYGFYASVHSGGFLNLPYEWARRFLLPFPLILWQTWHRSLCTI